MEVLLTSHHLKFYVFFILAILFCYLQGVSIVNLSDIYDSILKEGQHFNASFILRIADKPISFELSLGNAGNSLDGQLTTVCNEAHLFSQNFHNVKMSKFFAIKIFKLRQLSDNSFAITRIFFFFKFSKRFKHSKCQSIQNIKVFKMSKFSKCQNFQICTVNCQRFAMTRIILQNTWPQLDFHHLSLHTFNRFTPSQESHPSTIKQRISFFSFFLQKIKRDDQVPHDDTDNGEAGEEVGFCSYFQICDQFDELRS